ncbi:hypothetical protein NOK12_39360 [Nocardioides sp. OK12]|nr:hypothetical protein NOK12_39360 [Nocardioides sp. OK12]
MVGLDAAASGAVIWNVQQEMQSNNPNLIKVGEIRFGMVDLADLGLGPGVPHPGGP